MTTFLFWNVFKKDLSQRLARLVVTHEVDVVVLVETACSGSEIAGAISAAGGHSLTPHGLEYGKARVLSRFESGAFTEKLTYGPDRLTIFEAFLPGMKPILLAAAHLPSLKDRSRGGLALSTTNWSRQIRDREGREGHSRTIIVGDMNMNPFDDGMVGGQGFHAVMTRSKALQRNRRIDGELCPFFYNPMWGFFGDRTPGPPGTYYLSGTDPINYFWNMYDQVLVRPELIPHLHDVSILDHDGRESLLTKGGFPQKRASDHLPLLFRICPS